MSDTRRAVGRGPAVERLYKERLHKERLYKEPFASDFTKSTRASRSPANMAHIRQSRPDCVSSR